MLNMRQEFPIIIFKMMVVQNDSLNLFQLSTILINTNHIKLRFIMKSDALLIIWIRVFPIGIFQVSTSPKWCLCIYFSWVHDYWTSNTRNSLVHNLWSEMVRCEKRAFQLLKMRRKNQLKHKNQVRYRLFIDN